MPRDIDVAALRFLRRKYGVIMPKGSVLFRQGQTSQEFFVVLTGKVEMVLEIPPPDQPSAGPRRKEVLRIFEAGEFFGEMAAFTGEPRSATATVAEDASLLYFDSKSAIELLKTSPQFALGMIQVLCDRVRASNDQLTALRLGLDGGDTAARTGASGEAAEPEPLLEVKPINEERFWLKQLTCPISRDTFSAPNPRTKFVQLTGRDSDFREIHQGINPLYYAVYVCPCCYYAAYPDDFTTVAPNEIPLIRQYLDQSRAEDSRYDFSGERDPRLALQSFVLAVRSYEQRRTSTRKRAGLYQRMAWIAREMGRVDDESRFLERALDLYRTVVEKERPTVDSEGTLTYLIGELSARLGKVDDALRWWRTASDTEEAKRKASLARMIRDRSEELRFPSPKA